MSEWNLQLLLLSNPSPGLHPLSATETTVQNIPGFLSCPWYLWWSLEYEGNSPSSSLYLRLERKSRQEAERVAGHSSSHHLPTTHTWLRELCKLGGLHHLYLTPSEIGPAAATVNIDKMLANGGREVEEILYEMTHRLMFVLPVLSGRCGNLWDGFS